eukprot:1141070-Rhodomonas_salina.3
MQSKGGMGLFAKCYIEEHRYVCEYWGLQGNTDDGTINSLQGSCQFEEVEREGEREVWIQTLQDVQAGEELTLHYNVKKIGLKNAFGRLCLCTSCIP